ncbi:MAG TPA: SDR family NAD(P)-dependent oxidoreductase [Mucilaginibacter sp.]|jgi:NAD(P)-dependent dehydrogenase (short-subunit alcohol dehydrogenase family)
MKIANKTILITGANRGIGNALLEEALKKGAKRVYAGTRVPFSHPDDRVIPLKLDVTDTDQIKDVAAKIESLDILVNNAGVAFYDNLDDGSMIEKHLSVNLYGTYNLTRALLPVLINSKGAIVNILSLLSLAPLPPIASYSISKAAAFSMTQSLRAFLAMQGVRVHAVLTGPVDTDMNRGLDIPKASPELAAQNIFAGVEKEEDEIFPEPMSASVAESWNNSAMKGMEKQNAVFVTV